MIVSTCGFGSTGSSAVSDYLMECENTQILDKIEFTIASRVDGLADLEHAVMDAIAAGVVTGDLAALMESRPEPTDSAGFLSAVRSELEKKYA